MIWVRRMIEPAEWQEIEDGFENLFIKLGCPKQMMLVAGTGETHRPTLFASLPNTAFLNAVAGFESVSEGDLPAEATLIIGHNEHFRRYFHPAARKPFA
jgi:hypothetical protein